MTTNDRLGVLDIIAVQYGSNPPWTAMREQIADEFAFQTNAHALEVKALDALGETLRGEIKALQEALAVLTSEKQDLLNQLLTADADKQKAVEEERKALDEARIVWKNAHAALREEADTRVAMERRNWEAYRADERRRQTAWEETAMQAQRNCNYYRDLVVKIGEIFNPEAYVADDGVVHLDVLCAKVPEVVEAYRAGEKGRIEAAVAKAYEHAVRILEDDDRHHAAALVRALTKASPVSETQKPTRYDEYGRLYADHMERVRQQCGLPSASVAVNKSNKPPEAFVEACKKGVEKGRKLAPLFVWASHFNIEASHVRDVGFVHLPQEAK